MKLLYDEIQALDNWNYYFKEHSLSIPNWNNLSDNQKFIEDFLTISGKESVKSHFFTKDLEEHGICLDNFDRAIHTNSVFFIGCLLYEKLSLKNKINFVREDKKEDEFHFIWFLTSLIHDFGYFAENDKSKFAKITEEISSIERNHDLLNYKNDNGYLTKAYNTYQKSTQDIIDYIPTYFKEAFNGKRSSKKGKQKIEHGIYAGLLLYDGLVTNRLVNKDKDKDNPKLYWQDDLDKFYALASFAIAIHNIRRDGIPDNLKFSINKEPFLFLFGLADTIEPIKIFDNSITPKEDILKSILIDINNNIITLCNDKPSKLDFSKLTSRISTLSSWLNTKIYIEENKLTIEICEL